MHLLWSNGARLGALDVTPTSVAFVVQCYRNVSAPIFSSGSTFTGQGPKRTPAPTPFMASHNYLRREWVALMISILVSSFSPSLPPPTVSVSPSFAYPHSLELFAVGGTILGNNSRLAVVSSDTSPSSELSSGTAPLSCLLVPSTVPAT